VKKVTTVFALEIMTEIEVSLIQSTLFKHGKREWYMALLSTQKHFLSWHLVMGLLFTTPHPLPEEQ
jgi:hypothetical protein